jgi:hypothetical protein
MGAVKSPSAVPGAAIFWFVECLETQMAAGKLIVSTYLQYILIAEGVFLLVVFVRQLSGGFGHPREGSDERESGKGIGT